MIGRGGRDLVDEAIEQVERVVRAWTGFGVVLDGRTLDPAQPQALDGPVSSGSIYVVVATSGSVMMVAGLELTRMIR